MTTGRRNSRWLLALAGPATAVIVYLAVPASHEPVVHAATDGDLGTTPDATPDEAPVPTVGVVPAAALTGQVVEVTLRDWPAGVANLEVCANGGQRGSADCDVLGAAAVVVPASGTTSAQFTVGDPPGDCPCVVRATQVGGRATALASIVLTDAPDSAGPDIHPTERHRQLELVDVHVERSHSWPALFGAGADRTLTATVRNTGNAPVSRPVLSVSFADGDRPAEVVRAVELDRIEPGGDQEVDIELTLPAFSFGSHDVLVRVDGGDQPVTAATKTGMTPWGLAILAGLGAYLVVMRGVIAVLSRRHRRNAPSVPATTELTPAAFVATSPRAIRLASPDRRYDRPAIQRVLDEADISDRTRALARSTIDTLADSHGLVGELVGEDPTDEFTVDGRTLAGVIAVIAAVDTLLELDGCDATSDAAHDTPPAIVAIGNGHAPPAGADEPPRATPPPSTAPDRRITNDT